MAFLENMNLTSSRLKLESARFWVETYKNTELWNWPKMVLPLKSYTVKLGIKELLNKEQIGFNELFTDYQLFYTMNFLIQSWVSFLT